MHLDVARDKHVLIWISEYMLALRGKEQVNSWPYLSSLTRCEG
jgi:hypothetical protein